MDEFSQLPPQAPPAGSSQRRGQQRHRVLKSGKIILENLSSLSCQLRDLSDTGAKLIVANGMILPKTFRLFITADNSIRDVEVAWRKTDSVGVHFLGPPKSSALRKL
jgi:c-di-GMP-binding flagellar brake protein YcgR